MSKNDSSKTAVDALTEAAAKAELKRLAAEIGAHDKRYFQEDAPTVSDAAYDVLRRRNQAIEARFPQLVRSGIAVQRRGFGLDGRFRNVRVLSAVRSREPSAGPMAKVASGGGLKHYPHAPALVSAGRRSTSSACS